MPKDLDLTEALRVVLEEESIEDHITVVQKNSGGDLNRMRRFALAIRSLKAELAARTHA